MIELCRHCHRSEQRHTELQPYPHEYEGVVSREPAVPVPAPRVPVSRARVSRLVQPRRAPTPRPRIVPEDCAQGAELARQLGVKKSTVGQWAARASYNGFPAPAGYTPSQRPFWRIADVVVWRANYQPAHGNPNLRKRS